jgi:hypothetical protein
MDDGPMKSALDSLDSQGVIEHTLTTYRNKSGILVKETTTRRYFEDGDYLDSSSSNPLIGGSAV